VGACLSACPSVFPPSPAVLRPLEALGGGKSCFCNPLPLWLFTLPLGRLLSDKVGLRALKVGEEKSSESSWLCVGNPFLEWD
jgi:hypothetical protein